MSSKISLVIPAYNEEKYIASCLQHAIENSNGAFHEIIVIDNASTDKTADIAKRFPQVKVIREDKKGLTKARQKGLESATGTIIAYIDADTKMPKNWPQRVIEHFSKNQEVVCVSGPYKYYDIPKSKQAFVSLYWNLLAVPMSFITGYIVVGGNFAIKKETLEKMGGFDTTIAFYGEDTDIGRRAHEHGKVKFVRTLVMPTSGRRLTGQGTINTAFTYVLNFLSQVLLKKPITHTYKDLR